MFENHLIEIFAYRAKMEKLKELKTNNVPQTPIVYGDLVITKNVQNEVSGVAKGATGVSINKET